MNNVFEILSCSSTAESCCSDYVLVNALIIIKKTLTVMQIVVPIILILMLTVQLIKLVINPTEKKNISGIKNEIIGTIVFFLLPYIVNVVFGLVPDSFEMSACWRAAEQTKTMMDKYEKSPETNVDDFLKSVETKKKKSTKKKKVSKKSLKKLNSVKKNKRLKKQKSKLGKIKGTKNGIKLASFARGFVGNRYCWGGTNPNVCADCSGFVQYVFRHYGIELPRTSKEQYNATSKYTRVSPNNIKAGDVVMYDGHVAILTGNGEEIVHAASTKDGIKISPTYKYAPIKCIARIKGLN